MGKVILITGATDGIGKQTAIDLANMGYKIVVHGRNKEKAKNAADQIIEKTDSKKIDYIHADLSSLKEVRRMADEIHERVSNLNILINNAGVYKNEKELTEDGFEATIAINHLAPFLLTNLLLDLLEKNSPSRIINVSSVAHLRGKIDFENMNAEKSYNAYGFYAASKLMNVIFSNELAERLKNKKITVNSLHPGVISTKLLKQGFGMEGDSLKRGAETSVYLASSDDVKSITGKYFDNSKIADYNKLADDKSLKEKLWNWSMKSCSLKTL